METKNFFVHDGLKVRGDTLLNGDTYNDTALAKLHVKAADNGASANLNNVNGLIIENDQTSNTNYALKLATGTGNIFSVTNAGNLGIGTTDPSASLDVIGTICADSDSWFNGVRVGLGNNSCGNNTVVGCNALYSNTTGNKNTAFGYETLCNNTTGYSNTAIGYNSLICNTGGIANTATGTDSLKCNTTGIYNTSSGFQSLNYNTTGNGNTSTGFRSLYANSTGNWNTASGLYSLRDNTTGCFNVAHGKSALHCNTTGSKNTASGYESLKSNTIANNNTSYGYQSLCTNVTGSSNTSLGLCSLHYNTTGYSNTSTGSNSLFCNTTGYLNTAQGVNSLNKNTTGYHNTASGYGAVRSNTTGYRNTGTGYAALFTNTTGYLNTANGGYSLFKNTTGTYNVAYGYESLRNNTVGNCNITVGYFSGCNITTGSNNITIGVVTCTSSSGDSNSIVIGNNLTGLGSNTINIGNSNNTKTVFEYGNVGIGNTNPNKKLSVTGEVSGTSHATFDGRVKSNKELRVSADYSINYFYKADNTTMLGYLLMRDDNNSLLSLPAGQDFRLMHANTTRIAVASAGNVGIGTTDPNEKLTVSGNISASGTIYADSFNSNTGGSTIDFNDDVDLNGNLTFSSSSDILIPDNSGAALEIKEGSNVYQRFITTNGGEKIELYKCTTASAGFYTNSLSAISVLAGDGSVSVPSYSFIGDTNTGMWRPGSDQLRFNTGGVDRLCLTPSLATFTNSVTISNDLNVIGNFTVNGTTVTQDVSTVLIEDPVIKLANGNTSADIKDIGFYGEYADSGTKYTGLIRDVTFAGGNKPYVFFEGATTDILSGNDSGSGKPTVANFADVYMGRIGVNTSTYNATTRVEINLDNGENIHFDGDGDLFVDIDRNASGDAGRLRYQTNGTDEFEIGLIGGTAGYHITDGSVNSLLTVLSSGNVGIGTTSPIYDLHARRSGNGRIVADDGTAQTKLQASGGIGYVGTLTNHDLRLTTNNTDRVTIDASGNVGISTTEPSYPLDVVGYVNSSIGYRAGNYTILNETGNETSFGNTAYYGVSFKTNNATRMKITNAGNVGIGTTAPDTILHVQGSSFSTFERNTSCTNVSRTAADFDHTTTGDMDEGFGSQIRFTGGDTGCSEATFAMLRGLRGSADSEGEFSITAGTNGGEEFMRIDQDGNVGIGTTSPSTDFSVKEHLLFNDTTRLLTISNNTNTGGINLDGGNSRLYFSGYRALEGNNSGTTLTVGEGYGTTRISSVLNVVDHETILSPDQDSLGGVASRALTIENINDTSWTADALTAYNATTSYDITDRASYSFFPRPTQGNILTFASETANNSTLHRFVNLNSSATEPLYRWDFFQYDGSGTGTGDFKVPDKLFQIRVREGVSNVEKFTIKGNGNVGIGTNDPNYKLEIDGTTDFGGTTTYNNGAAGLISWNAGTKFKVRGQSGHALSLGANGTEDYVWIATDGNVGIGTDNPVASLHVRSSENNIARFSGLGTAGTYIKLDESGTQAWVMGIDNGDTTLKIRKNDYNGDVSVSFANNQQLQFNAYGCGTFTGTQAYNLGVDSSGNIIEIDLGDGVIDGSGTANRLAYWSDSSTLSADSDLYYDSTNNYIGIGTDTPGEAIDIVGGNVQADEFIGNLRGAVLFKAKAGEALTKGDVVYISGISGNTTVVSKADADDAAKMPAFGIADETASLNSSVDVIKFGTVSNLDTSSWPAGTELYVGTTAGALVSSAPTGESAAIQKIAKVTRQDNSAGSMTVMGAGRTNAVPNLNEGHLFVGNASNQAVSDNTLHVDIANSKVGVGTPSPAAKFEVTDGSSSITLQEYSNGAAIFLDGVDGDFTGGDYFHILANSNSYLGLGGYAGGATPLNISNSGNVGIGTASPSQKLHVNGRSKFGNAGKTEGGFVINYASFGEIKSGLDTLIGNGVVPGTTSNTIQHSVSDAGQFIKLNYQKGITFHTNITNTIDTDIDDDTNERVRIDSSGNVGIGTIAPWEKLTVYGGGINFGNAPNVNNSGKLTYNSTSGQLKLSAHSNGGNTYQTFTVSNGGSQVDAVTILNDGNVGIGTDDPDAKLHVEDATRAALHITASSGSTQDAFIKFEATDVPAAYMGIDDSLQLFKINNATNLSTSCHFVIDSSGNVGIGTTDPNSLLHIDTGANSAANFKLGANRTAANTAVGQVVGDWNGTVVAKIALKTGDDTTNKDNGEIAFEVAAAGSTAEAMRIDSSGNVGIGTDDPGAKLDVNGISRFRDELQIYSTTTDIGAIGNYNGALNIQGTSTRDVSLGSDSYPQTVFIEGSNGNVGIGTQSPGAKLDIYGQRYSSNYPTMLRVIDDVTAFDTDNNGGGISFGGKHTSSGVVGFLAGIQGVKENNTSGNYDAALRFLIRENSTSLLSEKMRIDSSGNVGIGTDSPNDKLDIHGNMRFRSSDGFGATSTGNYNPSYVAFPGGGKVGSASSSQAGYVKITLPQSWTNTMMQFSVDIFEYQANKAKTFVLAGYNYAPSGGSWVNASAMVLAADDGATYKVQFGHDGSKCAIYISKGTSGASTSWSYPYVVVRDASFGFTSTGISNWIDGWSVSFSTATLSGITQTRDISTQVTGTGTSQYITKWNSTGTAITDSVIVQDSNNIGIGTTDPQAKLHIDTGSSIGTIDTAYSLAIRGDGIDGIQILSDSAYSGRIVFGDQNSNNVGQIRYDHSTDAFRFFTNGTEKVSILSGGNVGIGTDNPSYKFEITSDAGSGLISRIYNTNADGQGLLIRAGSTASATRVLQLASENDTKIMTVNSNGKVGIGTASPNEDLDIAGTFRVSDWGHFSNSGGNEIVLGSSGANYGFIMNPSAGVWSLGYGTDRDTLGTSVLSWSSSNLVTINNAYNLFLDGGNITLENSAGDNSATISNDGASGSSKINVADSLYVIESGNVGIGTTNPSSKLHVSGNTYLNSGAAIWNLIGNNGINFARETNFGYSSTYRILQLGTVTTNRAISIGVDVTANPSGSFGGDEIIFPNQKEIITPNAANNGYLGLIATDNQNKVRIGNYRWDILNDTPGITIDTSSSTNYVGIGTTTPAEKLTVIGDILIDNGGDSTLYLGKGAEGVDGVTKIKSVQTGGDTDQLGIAFNVHSNTAGSAVSEEAMRIDHSGNVGIGTDDPNARLQVNQAASDQSGAAAIKVIGTAYGTNKTIHAYMGTTSNTKSLFYAENSNGVVMNIAGDGNTSIGGNILPSTDNTRDLGSSSNRWANVYANCTTTGAVIESNLCTNGLDSCPEGSVVIWRDGELQGTTDAYSHRVMGVTAPGSESPIVMGAENILVTGDIEEGDPIVTSDKYNHGMRGDRAEDLHGKVIAEALESGSGESYIIKGMIRKF